MDDDVVVGRRLLQLHDPLEDEGVDDRLQRPPLLLVGEDQPPFFRPVQVAVGREQLGPELGHDLLEPGRALGHDLTREHVGVDDHRAEASSRIADTVLLPDAMPPVSPTRMRSRYGAVPDVHLFGPDPEAGRGGRGRGR